MVEVLKIKEYKYLIPKTSGMFVDGLIYSDDNMIEEVKKDNAFKQVVNVATLPGIFCKSFAMPDIHYGYGFPIGGVAAFDVDNGVISPGGIGYDINCGVRLLRTSLNENEMNDEIKSNLCDILYKNIPSGIGSTGRIRISSSEVRKVLENGVVWAIKNGYGNEDDAQYCEENGCMDGGESKHVSERAIERGKQQIGTLGSGNHFLEIQTITDIYDNEAAKIFGISKGQITIMIHTGSRGLGYQICDDYLKVMMNASSKYKINLVDRQLACAPFKSDEGRKYFSAMKCGANYAWANRQCIMHWVRECIKKIFGANIKVELVYDVSHNVGKIEEHNGKKLIIHRKGATRSFAPGRDEIPLKYKDIGQPVIIPGTMGTSSYVMKGTIESMTESFGSTCHGAGRIWSRTRALKTVKGNDVVKNLQNKGIMIRAKSFKTVAEETPEAYKDISKVIEICHNVKLSKKVARMVPLAVIKG